MGELIQEGGTVGRDWLTFLAAVGTILSALAVLWIYSPTGYGDDFLAALESACGGNSHLVTLCFGIIFPVVHSGLASLRPYATKLTGERLWRVIFATFSLPLAYSWIVYFIAHAHDGIVFWDGEHAALHAAAWCAPEINTFVKFLGSRTVLPFPIAFAGGFGFLMEGI
jgi:zeta-carotene isomerase